MHLLLLLIYCIYNFKHKAHLFCYVDVFMWLHHVKCQFCFMPLIKVNSSIIN